ncbi:MAG: aspartate/glutamate racemase family protein [Bacteroidales bacterium]|nr:aspartate/glutamate racemase family protein [Bacteroidales bacterium]
MKTIGIIGGMSWESSKVYYEIMNEKTKSLLGGFHSCPCILYSVDFEQVERLQHEDNWDELDKMMAQVASRLEQAGAELIIMATNTMHLCTPAILKNISVPFLHIAEATGLEITRRKINRVALLGTKFTMERDFYKKLLEEKFGIEVIVPDLADRQVVHDIIYKELVEGIINEDSREKYKEIIKKLENRGAEGVILGCTEIPLLISEKDVEIEVFDTTRIHAEKAVETAINFKNHIQK